MERIDEHSKCNDDANKSSALQGKDSGFANRIKVMLVERVRQTAGWLPSRVSSLLQSSNCKNDSKLILETQLKKSKVKMNNLVHFEVLLGIISLREQVQVWASMCSRMKVWTFSK